MPACSASSSVPECRTGSCRRPAAPSATPWSLQSRSPGPGSHLCPRGTRLPALLPVAGTFEHVLCLPGNLAPDSPAAALRASPPRVGVAIALAPPQSALPSEALRLQVGPPSHPRPGPDHVRGGLGGCGHPRRSSHTGCGRVVAEGGDGGFWGLPRPPASSLGDLAELGVSRVGTGRGGDSWAWPRPRVTGWEDQAWGGALPDLVRGQGRRCPLPALAGTVVLREDLGCGGGPVLGGGPPQAWGEAGAGTGR